MTNLIAELIEVSINALRNNKKVRRVLAIIIPIIFLVLLFIYIPFDHYKSDIELSDVELVIKNIFPFIFIILGVFYLIILISFTKFNFDDFEKEFDLDTIREERQKIQERLSKNKEAIRKTEENIFDTIQLSLNQITEYYTINQSQARRSFHFSLFAIIIGLVTLIVGIWIFYFGNNPSITPTIIYGVTGLIIEFIGGSYFYLYNKSLSQIKFFYEKLINMQDTMLAVQLSETLPDNNEVNIKERLIMKLINRSSIDLKDINNTDEN